ncbi:class I SAM-dependent methyltransferase [Rhodobacter sp. Har01]|uniref:class I SAM-dependent methyltransferase n=1 Tax=Rhodobacter sp. Har01 TaxID=2883999 RepID=UPI001D094459|nr:class I SAM-dependent methyltransferase [Rhodobacter sp. Har01]MCB6178986.1 class I SAM-dependent methyltransferase [Rhodobacter sp. Har01]
MGRWSRQTAPLFLDWLAPLAGLDWVEVGCGTGALSAQILARGSPASLTAIDPSAGFVAKAQAALADPRARFAVGDAQALDLADASADIVVSALALNFIPDRAKALSEMCRVARPGGTIACYVWDYPGGGVEFMRAFWTAAVTLDPAASDLTEDKRFPFCTPDALTHLLHEAGLSRLACQTLTAPTRFVDFDDFWRPFALGAGPAPGYCASLAPDHRQRLQDRLSADLPRQADGSIVLHTRAWALRGTSR